MKVHWSIVAVLIAVAGPAAGGQWKPVSVTPQQSIYIDLDTLVRSGDTVQAWDWQKFSANQDGSTGQETFQSVKSLTNYHCQQRTTDAVLKVYLRSDGTEVTRAQLQGLAFPAAVEPDSLREKLLRLACDPPTPRAKQVVHPASVTGAKAGATSDSTPGASGDADVGKADPAIPEDAAAESKAEPASNVTKPAKSTARAGKRPERQRAAARHPVKVVGKKSADKMLKATRQAGMLNCPEPPALQASALPQIEPSPQLSDAGSDVLFN
jgi:hypothetical protein